MVRRVFYAVQCCTRLCGPRRPFFLGAQQPSEIQGGLRREDQGAKACMQTPLLKPTNEGGVVSRQGRLWVGSVPGSAKALPLVPKPNPLGKWASGVAATYCHAAVRGWGSGWWGRLPGWANHAADNSGRQACSDRGLRAQVLGFAMGTCVAYALMVSVSNVLLRFCGLDLAIAAWCCMLA